MTRTTPGSSIGALLALSITYFVPSRRPSWLRPPTLDERVGSLGKTQPPARSKRKTPEKRVRA